MATALQQQLAVIAANSTHQLDLKAQKARHSKSLLFEPRDAASQNFETIYQICLEGFHELCQLDVRFAPFARSLFSEQSKNEDRGTMTAQENAELDNVIERFLGLLGGRLLLKPAMKAAEWLVRRFRVHEHNTDILLMTFLPYHSSHIFPTLLSILPEQLPPNFRFLHPYVASLQSPPRHVIVGAASNQSAFFTAFSQYVLNVAKARYQSALLLGFWASITAQAVNVMIDSTRSGRETVRRQKEEDLLLKVLPILQTALSIKGVPELYLGSGMIMTILATKSSLSDKALNAMMEAVVNGWTEQTVRDGMICLAVLAEEREDDHLPRSITKAIMKEDLFIEMVERIGVKCRVEKLLVGAALGSVRLLAKEADHRAASLLAAALVNEHLSEEGRVTILEGVMKTIESTGDRRDSSKDILSILGSFAENDNAARLVSLAAERARINTAILGTDLVLQLQVKHHAEEEDEDKAELMLIDDKPADSHPRPALDLDALPNLPSKDASFLDRSHQQLFTQYGTTFYHALPSEQDLSTLLKLPPLERSACAKRPSTLTFFARVWSSDAPISARVKALQIACELLQQIREGEPTIDMQALLPYLITSLSDPAKPVRIAAGMACRAIGGLYRADAQKSRSSECITWSRDTIYGDESSYVHWLSTTDAGRLVEDAILPIIEDCAVDAQYIVQSLANILNGSSNIQKPQRKELKMTMRPAVFAFMASHVVTSPCHVMKLRLLSILNKVGKHAGTARSQVLLPYTRAVIAKDGKNEDEQILAQALLGCISHRSNDEVQFLREVAEANTAASRLAFGRLRTLWKSMKEQTHIGIVDWLLNLSLNSQVPGDVQSEALDTLRSLSMSTEVLVHLLESLPSATNQPTPAQKQRTGRASDVHKLSSTDKERLNAGLPRLTIVLELVEESKPERHPLLLKGLFHILSELHHYRIALDSELVYLQGLIINNLLSVVNGLKATANKDVDRSVIRADLIVDCVRDTSNTQVHHAALMLMSALASWAPDLVLHNVMPLFTFMSSTILKQGDEYSAHVTDQTVSRIIPPLAASLKKRGKDLISGAADLLLSFTAAYEHIPLHRRSDLFRNLVDTLGADQSLFAVAAMLIERQPQDPGVRRFVAELMGSFAVDVQLTAIKQYLDLAFDTLKPRRALSDIILGYSEKSKEQAKEATSVLIDGLADVLNRDILRKKLAKELKAQHDPERIRIAYSVALEKTMQLGLQLKSDAALHDNAANLLTAVLGLMPTADFIDSSAKLMQTGTDEIRQQVFRSLEQRVVTAKRGDAAMQQVFVEMLPNCTLFVVPSQPIEVRLAAIACIDRISEKFGKTGRATVLNAAQHIVGDAALGSEDDRLRRLSLLCLASMVEVLGDEFIPILPNTLDKALSYMEQTVRDDDVDEYNVDLLSAGFSFAMGILDHAPWLLAGSHLDRLFVVAADYDENEASDFTQLAARKLPAQDCLGAIERTWNDIVALGGSAARLYMETLQAAIKHHTKSTVLRNAQLLFTILFHAFDLRRNLLPEADAPEHYQSLFDLVDSTTMDTVLKLNDATFRPFFLRLGEWAREIPNDRVGTVYRQMSLYSFTHTLFQQLKSLVTSYYAFILEDSVSLFASLGLKKDNERQLLDLVLQCLTANLTHDQDGFWQTPAHFDPVVGPLLRLHQHAGDLDLGERVIPAIVALAVAANSPDQHKTLNSTIMTGMRHEEPAVRLAAVKTERALTERLNVDWVGHLPEWLPLISELQEDDDGVVERETLRWMKQIEDVTGEDLNSMLQ